MLVSAKQVLYEYVERRPVGLLLGLCLLASTGACTATPEGIPAPLLQEGPRAVVETQATALPPAREGMHGTDPYPDQVEIGSAAIGQTGSTGADAYPEPDPDATLAVLSGGLRQAISSVDAIALDRMRRGDFTTVYYPGRGSDVDVSNYETTILDVLDFPTNGGPTTFDTLPTSLPPIDELLRGCVNPDHRIRETIFSRGWGSQGRGETVFILMQDENGNVSLAARVYAEDGFDRGLTSGSVPDTRAVALANHKRPQVIVEIDVPLDWHMQSEMGVASYPPWEYKLHPEWNPAGFRPGQTKIELAGYGRNQEPTTLDAAAASVTFFDEPRVRQETEPLTLNSGEEALLTTTTFASATKTELFVDLGDGIAGLFCYGEQEPCADILRTARVQ